MKKSNQGIDSIYSMVEVNMIGKASKDGKRKAAFRKRRIYDSIVGKF